MDFGDPLPVLNSTPSKTRGRLAPTPIAIVAGALRRAWVRIADRDNGERSLLDHAISFSGDLESLLVQHAVRHGQRREPAHRVFRAPELVYNPSLYRQPVRRARPDGTDVSGSGRVPEMSRAPR